MRMRRRVSVCEKHLIENGWELHSKKYCGKHKDRILSYVYTKYYDNLKVNAYVELKKPSLEVLNYGFNCPSINIDTITIGLINGLMEQIRVEIDSTKELDIEQEIEIAETCENYCD